MEGEEEAVAAEVVVVVEVEPSQLGEGMVAFPYSVVRAIRDDKHKSHDSKGNKTCCISKWVAEVSSEIQPQEGYLAGVSWI